MKIGNMFEEDDINFNLQLEKWNVDMSALKEHVLCAWVEDQEQKIRKKNDCLVEAWLLQKYRIWYFMTLILKKSYLVVHSNMEYHREKGQCGWYGTC